MSYQKKENNDGSPVSIEENQRVTRPLLHNPEQSSPQSRDAFSKSEEDSDLNDVSVVVRDEKGIIMNKPADKLWIVYCVMLLFGIVTLLPWNIFINAEDYFKKYKLNTNTSANATYRNDFTFYTAITGQLTNVVMNFINIFISFGGNPKNRIPYAIGLCAAIVFCQVIFAIVDSSQWPLAFFILTVVSVFIMFIAIGVLNSCVYYVASIFPMEYVNAIIIGNNVAGIFTSIMSIVSKLMSENLKISGIVYFLAAFTVVLFGLFGYFAMHRTRYYQYYSRLSEENNRKNGAQANASTRVPYGKIILKTWPLLFCIWLNFHCTLTIFPVYQLGVKPSPDFFINDETKFKFQDVVTFLTFNVFVLIGNFIPKLIRKPGPKWIPIPVILRCIVSVVFFALCNFKPDDRTNGLIPILITDDYIYWIGCALSPMLFGYFTSLMMMYIPTLVEPQHAGHASMIAALMIAIGVASGLNFTPVLEWIVLLKRS